MAQEKTDITASANRKPVETPQASGFRIDVASAPSAAPRAAAPMASGQTKATPRPAAASPVTPTAAQAAPAQHPVRRPVTTEQNLPTRPVRSPSQAEPTRRLAAGPARKKPSLSEAKPSIGGLIYALDAKPSKKPYMSATIFSVIWFFIGGLLGWVAVGQNIGQFQAITDVALTPAIFIIAACILIPIAMAWMMATLAVRAQEMKLMASAMTEVAIRLAEPDKMAEQKVASIGQTIRRQISSMDDAISHSIARAGELETIVHREITALEKSYDRNENVIKGLVSDLATERKDLLKHGQDVVAAIGQVGHLVDQKLVKSSSEVAKSLARKSAEAAHKLHEANAMVTSKLENINQQVTDSIPAMMDKLVSEQARMDKVVKTADTSLKNLHGNLAKQTGLLAKQSTILTEQSDTLQSKTEKLGETLAEQTSKIDAVLTNHSKKMNKSLTQRVLALDASLGQRAKAIDLTLDQRTNALNQALDQRSAALSQTLDEKALNIDNSIAVQTDKLYSAMDSKSAQMDATLSKKTAEMDAALGQKASAMDHALSEKARAMDAAIGQRMVEMNQKLDGTTRVLNDSISDHVAALDQSLGEKAVAMDAAFSQKARALDASLENKARSIDKSLTQRISEIDSSMENQANAMSATLGLQTSKMKRTLDEHSSTIESSLQAQTNLLDKTLSMNNQSILDTSDQFSMSTQSATNAFESRQREAAENQRRQEEDFRLQQQQAEEKQRREAEAFRLQQQQAEQRQQTQADALLKQQQADQEAQKLHLSSSDLIEQIRSLTQQFESQGIAILDEARTLEAAIVKGRDTNSAQHLEQLSAKTTELDQTRLLFTRQIQEALAQTQHHADTARQGFSADQTMTGQQKLREVSKLREVAREQAERAVTKLEDSFVLVTKQVGLSVQNASQYQSQEQSTKPSSGMFSGLKKQGSATNKANNGKKSSQWSMGDLLSSSANKDPDTPTYKPASSSQGAAEDAVHMDPLDVLRIDEISRAIDSPTATDAWLRYQNGEKNIFTRNLYNPDGQLTFDRIQGRYQTDMSFRDTVERYVQDYEGLLSESEQNDPSGETASAYLTTETGRVYLMLAHISGRLG